MKNKMEMLDQWLKDVCPSKETEYIKVEYDSFPVEGLPKADFKHKRIINFYTDHNRYHITAIDRGRGRSYLGCSGTARKPLAGEDWMRGNDITNGPFTEKTWNKILSNIVRYELVELAPPVKRVADTPETKVSEGGLMV